MEPPCALGLVSCGPGVSQRGVTASPVSLEGRRGRCVPQGGHREPPGALAWLSLDPRVAPDGHCGVPGYPARVLEEEGHHGFHGHPREVPQGLGCGGVQACPGKGFPGIHPPSVGRARLRKGLRGPWESVPRVGWRGAVCDPGRTRGIAGPVDAPGRTWWQGWDTTCAPGRCPGRGAGSGSLRPHGRESIHPPWTGVPGDRMARGLSDPGRVFPGSVSPGKPWHSCTRGLSPDGCGGFAAPLLSPAL